jgi:hypothetical protein
VPERADIRHVPPQARTPEGLPVALSDRFARSLAEAERAIAERSSSAPGRDATSSPEYREIVLLKVRLELEAARILSSAARLGAELVDAAEGLWGGEARP